MSSAEPTETITPRGAPALSWIGPDDRGVELEILAVVLDDLLLVIHVIHVMPTARRRS